MTEQKIYYQVRVWCKTEEEKKRLHVGFKHLAEKNGHANAAAFVRWLATQGANRKEEEESNGKQV